LVGIATRRALRYRALARHRVEVMGEPPAAAVPPVAEAALERDAASRLVHAALARIDGAQREVFVAHELGGTPVPEIARALGIPVDTAWSRLRRGRRAFGQAARRLA
ncbi:MAG TPA: sigma factor-like helix-turn-helix DNA-binding protein, partial [Myxococcota bacterium]|nr:sigma factor-like helix-turn-helix DNA-binding protein [Myxococcota bacterium]